uniref:von Willebrand factor A domain-containing protein 5A-like n=1 Tax=Sinocyclocheilus anshuiensis TaxID=1608454 RepID=A0A671PKQ3_9TELE
RCLCVGVDLLKRVLRFPLKSISVQLQVQDHVASVSSSLQYINEEDRPLEAVFVFPLPADAAVCHFSARIGEQEIVAEVQDKQSARDQYDDAVSSGQQAFLLEESDQSSDYSSSVGSTSCVRVSFFRPASAAGVPEVSSASVVPYTLSLSVEVRSSDRISRLESSCPLDPLEFLDAQHTHATVNLSAGHRFDKDVELLLYYENTHQPTAVVEAGAAAAQSGSLMGDPALMISLYPEFPADVMSSLASQGEFIFVVDRSGSMGCEMHHGKDAQKRIESARDTLLLLLKSLPMGCYFNIYGFGSRFESFFPQSVVYSEDAMEEALRRVKSMNADMGGTEILRPLKHIYSQPCYTDHPRQLFVFTDGEVWNTKEVLDLVKSQVFSHRWCEYGSRHRNGQRRFRLDGQYKMFRSLRFALQPAVDNISVDWTVPEGVTVEMLSPPISALFQGQRALIYAQIKGQSSGETEGAVTVKYRLKDQPATNQLQFTLLTIHWLAARSVIRSLELQDRAGGAAGVENIRSRIVELSVQAGVSSVHTAFIGVNKDSRQTVKGPLLQRRVLTERKFTDAVRISKKKKLRIHTCTVHFPSVPFPHLFIWRLVLRRSRRARLKRPPFVLPEPELQKDPLLQLVSLQKAVGCWELNAALAGVFGKTEDEVTNHRPAQVDGSVWATVLALIWLYSYKLDQQVEWQFVAMKAASWICSQKPGGLSQCVCDGNLLLGSQLTEDTLGI